MSEPRITPALPGLLVISLIGTLAEEAFNKSVVFDGIKSRWGAKSATVGACVLFFLFNGGYGGTVLCASNVLLMGLVCCMLYGRHGLWASVSFRWGWSLAVMFLIGFGNTSDYSVYALYHVSEGWLTGGNAGPICGLWTTLMLLAVITWLNRREICEAGRRLRAKRASKSKAGHD